MSLAEFDKLISWARDHGAHLHEQVEVYDDPKYGIALRVRTAQHQSSPEGPGLQPGSRIVSCPFVLCLSYLNVLNKFPDLRCHSCQFPSLFIKVLEPHVVGNFFLVQQYLCVETSHWGPYIRSLPQPEEPEKLGTPLYFTHADIAWIRGTYLEAAREQRERTWKSEWERGSHILDTSHGWEDWRGKWTWDLYKWAATIFSSRGFISSLIPEEVFRLPVIGGTARYGDEENIVSSGSQKDFPSSYQHLQTYPSTSSSLGHRTQLEDSSCNTIFPVLFPLLDLANHDPTARVTWFTNARNEPKDLSIIVDSEISYGHQIFNNYAQRSNTELMLGYGFCIPGNDEIAISFKAVGEEFITMRKCHWTCLDTHGINATQNTFHVRATPYPRSLDDIRLPEFKLLEDGFVDALAVLVANQRERDFMIKNPHHCPEGSSEAAFTSPLSRNILKVMSVLLEQMDSMLDKITSTSYHLDIPKTSCQYAAKIYRDGQISVLKAVTGPLQHRLDEAMSQHTICDNLGNSPSDQTQFIDMRLNVELVTLWCAFSWLQITHPAIYEHSIKVIANELEVTTNPVIGWIDLVTNGWDYTMWCFWVYIILTLHLLEERSSSHQGHVTRWIDHMLQIYNPDGTFPDWSCQQFPGDQDEGETLQVMAIQIRPLLFQDVRTLESLVDVKASNKLINLASTIAMEESFVVKVGMNAGIEKERVHQRVLFLKKFPSFSG